MSTCKKTATVTPQEWTLAFRNLRNDSCMNPFKCFWASLSKSCYFKGNPFPKHYQQLQCFSPSKFLWSFLFFEYLPMYDCSFKSLWGLSRIWPFPYMWTSISASKVWDADKKGQRKSLPTTHGIKEAEFVTNSLHGHKRKLRSYKTFQICILLWSR